ncbi:uncharacterized protein At4g15970-like isoform X2 [Prosopis cineraria]|uniref:uncharacterized protein At4g15970-like isoform X2 n=1 Tax=Prosopis cineraria TaxID=364024 RepID=UPI00240F530F|nr:uncharacterized protein At4g15970-like isoform X2 [Prosopis cineraria]
MGEYTGEADVRAGGEEDDEPEALLREPSLAGGASTPWNWGDSCSAVVVGRRSVITMVLVGLSVLVVFLLNSSAPADFLSISQLPKGNNVTESKLERVLRRATMENKTVILATLNDAWIEPGSIFDLFLESFLIGNNTQKLLNHLVLVTWDHKAYNRCLEVHPHCYQMETKGDQGDYGGDTFFMTPKYLHMIWRRTEFLSSVLHLGYSFVFTDLDIMWLRDPFERFFKDVDFQIACDRFNGNSMDTTNEPNGGFLYVRSNHKTKDFYKLWIESRKIDPKLNEQDVLNKIKTHSFVSIRKMIIRFLDTTYFGGFCQASRDFNKVCTMHANCCVGLDNKIFDLKILLQDWRHYITLNPDQKLHSHPSWRVPNSCRTSFERAAQKRNKENNEKSWPSMTYKHN